MAGCRRASPTRAPLHPRAPRKHHQPANKGCSASPPTTPTLASPTPEQRSNFLYHRLADRLPAWESAGAGTVETSWLREGVRLPWIREPPPPFHQGVSFNNLSDAQREFVTEALRRHFQETGAIEPATSQKYVTKAFLVPKPGNNKWRIVFDLRHVNKFMRKLSCRYETLKKLRYLAKQGDFMISIDLEDGFFHIKVHPDDRQYLTFVVEGLGAFQWAALPMGLSMSPYVFTKLMRVFVKALRAPLAPTATTRPPSRCRPPRRPPEPPPASNNYVPPHRRQLPPSVRVLRDLLPRFRALMEKGIRVLPYVDDFGFFFSTREEALEGRDYISAVLDLLGLSRNFTKGVWEPTQIMEHLGMGIDTVTGKFFVTPARLDKLQSFAKNILCDACSEAARHLVPKRRLAAFCGLAQSLYPSRRHATICAACTT